MSEFVNITCTTGRGFAWQSANPRDLRWWGELAADPIFALRWHRVKAHPNGCWLLQMAPCCRAGHVTLTKGRGRVYAHRHAYALAHGPIPLGRVVRHSCDDPACIYPGHLSIGSQGDNVGDSISRSRRNAFGRQRLQLADVARIRQRFAAGERLIDLARAYGVSKGCISAVVHYDTWNTERVLEALTAQPQQADRHAHVPHQPLDVHAATVAPSRAIRPRTSLPGKSVAGGVR